MAQPSNLPEWNTGAANRTEPSAPKKALGWEVDEAPPSSWFNWWQFTVYEWASYLKDLADGAEHWVARQLFDDGILVSAPATAGRHGVETTGKGTGSGVRGNGDPAGDGNGLLGVGGGTGGSGVHGIGTAANYPGVSAVGGPSGAGLIATGGANSGRGATLTGGTSTTTGVAGGVGEYIVGGAATVGNADGGVALSLVGGAGVGSGIQGRALEATVSHASTATASITNTSGGAAALALFTQGGIRLSGAAPDADDVVIDTLTRRNICKTFALVQLNGTASPTLVDGFNTGAPSVVGSVLRIPMADAPVNPRCVVANADGSGVILVCSPVVTAGAYLEIVLHRADTGAAIDPAVDTAGTIIHVMAFGG